MSSSARIAGQDLPAPVVSVLLPVRNAAPFLAAALDSLLDQRGVAFEVIGVDDASTDGSWTILAEYAQKCGAVVAARASGSGISDALNQALLLARGRFIARMDADDVCLPGRLAAQVAHLTAHPQLGMVGTQGWFIDTSGRRQRRIRMPMGSERIRQALEISSPFIHPSTMIRRDLIVAAGGYQRAFDGAEDYELWLRLKSVVAMDNMAEPLLLYRRYPHNGRANHALARARMAALAVVAHRRPGVLPDREGLTTHWRRALAAAPEAVQQVRLLTACFLADNGGSLTWAGAAYLEAACRRADGADGRLRRRLALACVRHQLQLLRSGHLLQSLSMGARDIGRWPLAILGAYVTHASILWRAAPMPSLARFGTRRMSIASFRLQRPPNLPNPAHQATPALPR